MDGFIMGDLSVRIDGSTLEFSIGDKSAAVYPKLFLRDLLRLLRDKNKAYSGKRAEVGRLASEIEEIAETLDPPNSPTPPAA